MEKLELEKWVIWPKKPLEENLDDGYIELVVRLKNDPQGYRPIKKEDLQELKRDLEDLGKWRKFKELKKDLEK